MTTANEIITAAGKVVEYAKTLGFTNAGIAYWDKGNPEYGYSSLEDLRDGACESIELDLGVYLRNPPLTIESNYDEEKDEYSWLLTP